MECSLRSKAPQLVTAMSFRFSVSPNTPARSHQSRGLRHRWRYLKRIGGLALHVTIVLVVYAAVLASFALITLSVAQAATIVAFLAA